MRPLLPFALLAATAVAQTTAPSLENLVQNSPFGTATALAQGPGAPAGPVEFRGTFVDRGERYFSILDTASRKAEWVGLNDSGASFLVKAYDADNETITLDYQGRSLSLKLRTAKISALATPPPQVAQPTPPPGGAPNVIPAVNPGAPGATEAQRLAQVAEEIRRRRALRQQAQGQPGNPPPPPNQPPR